MNEATTNEPVAQKTPHRVLFLHGLFRKRFPHSARTLAEILSKHIPGSTMSAMPDLLLDDGARCPRYLVKPTSGAGRKSVEIIDVVYDDIIETHDRSRSLLEQVIVSIGICLTQFPKLAVLFSTGIRQEIPRNQKIFVLLFAFSYPAYALLYLGLLASIGLGSWEYVDEFISQPPMAECNDCPESISSAKHLLPMVIGILALLVTAKHLLFSRRRSEIIENDAASAFAFVECQNPTSDLRRKLLGRVQCAIAASAKSNNNTGLSIFAYSHGALLAIDALFPAHPHWLPNVTGTPLHVRLFVTFGCPFAIANRFWPHRRPHSPQCQATVRQWLNFHESHDRLGGPLESALRHERVAARVRDLKFAYSVPTGERKWVSPHQAYWHEARSRQCEPIRRIADVLAGGSREQTQAAPQQQPTEY